MGAYPHSPRWKLLCRRLREAREQAGYTQVQAAAAIGKQQNFVSKSETGQRRLDPIELADFAALYGTTISALVPGDSSGRHRTCSPRGRGYPEAEAKSQASTYPEIG